VTWRARRAAPIGDGTAPLLIRHTHPAAQALAGFVAIEAIAMAPAVG
jgi:hypothetical protein